MPVDAATVTYSLSEPLDKAVEIICKSMVSRGLELRGQLDVSGYLERVLGISLPACRVVFVMPNCEKLSAQNIHPWAAIFLPQHVVISENAAHTTIYVQNRIHSTKPADGLLKPIIETQAQILEALEAVATRPSMVA